jgi:TPR repeat protein
MNEAVQQKLIEIVAEHGKEICNDPRRLEAVLRDFCGEHRREVFVLVNALKEQVATELISSPKDVLLEVLLTRLTKRLVENLALDEEAARWAAESWALALGVVSRGELEIGEGKTVGSSKASAAACAGDLAEVEREMVFDLKEAIRMAMRGKSTTAYLEKVYRNRLPSWRAAAERGLPAGQWLFGCCLEKGLGAEEDAYEAVRWYRRGAEQEFSLAQHSLGRCYRTGVGTAEDKREAVRWFKKAAEQGDAFGQHALGMCYWNGEGVAQDLGEAVKLFHGAAEQGYAKAQARLAMCYADGAGVDRDPTEAVRWYKRAAEQGYAEAQFLLGLSHFYGGPLAADWKGSRPSAGGDEDRVDFEEAVKWFRRAAVQGHPGAENRLGECLLNGFGVPENDAQGLKWFRKAAKQGHAGAKHNLGSCYEFCFGVNKDMAKAVQLYVGAAEQGWTEAQTSLALLYDRGEGVAQSESKAAQWYARAAEQGDGAAAYEMAERFVLGRGVTANEATSVRWLLKAADLGHRLAQYTVGMRYLHGRGLDKDVKKAAEWLRKAAEEGYADAQYELGLRYLRGEGIPSDETEALKWFQKAAEQGSRKAKGAIRRIERGPKPKRCFISSAVAEALGWSDNRREMNLLRHMRDTFMQETEERRKEVELYYRIATKIVDAVERSGHAEEIWRHVCRRYILPAVKRIEAGDCGSAHAIYSRMVQELSQAWCDAEQRVGEEKTD